MPIRSVCSVVVVFLFAPSYLLVAFAQTPTTLATGPYGIVCNGNDVYASWTTTGTYNVSSSATPSGIEAESCAALLSSSSVYSPAVQTSCNITVQSSTSFQINFTADDTCPAGSDPAICIPNLVYPFTVSCQFTSQSMCQAPTVPPPLPGSSWTQTDPQWASDPYDNVTGPLSTIGDQGCSLVAFNYVLNTNGDSFDPQLLNQDLDEFGDYSSPLPEKPGSGGRIIFASAVLDLSGGTLKWDPTYRDSTSLSALDSYLCSANPVDVIVRVANPTTGHQHYVVVTGKNGGSYNIVDPGYRNTPRTSLSSYHNKFTVVGAVKQPSGTDPSELDFDVVDTATLLVTAPDGTRTGFDPSTRQVLKGSPQSAYDAADNSIDTENEQVAPTSTTYSVQWFLPPTGNFVVQLTGLQLGLYQLAMKAYDANGKRESVAVFSGIANVGSASTFQVQYSPTPGSVPVVTRMASFQSTLADISNSRLSGAIANDNLADSLRRKIEAAASATREKEIEDAKEALDAFRNLVRAQTDKKITGAAPQVLLEDADFLISQLPHNTREGS